MQRSWCPLVRAKILEESPMKGAEEGLYAVEKKTPLWFSGSEAEARWQSIVLGLYQKAVCTLACDMDQSESFLELHKKSVHFEPNRFNREEIEERFAVTMKVRQSSALTSNCSKECFIHIHLDSLRCRETFYRKIGRSHFVQGLIPHGTNFRLLPKTPLETIGSHGCLDQYRQQIHQKLWIWLSIPRKAMSSHDDVGHRTHLGNRVPKGIQILASLSPRILVWCKHS